MISSKNKFIVSANFFLFLFFTSVIFTYSSSQILTFDFAGLAGSEATANSNFNHANLNSSTISRGAGLTATANADRFNAESWATGSIANAVTGNDYMQFTITPQAGYLFTVSSITIQLQRSGTGLTQIALRSSLDSYATNLDGTKNVSDITTTQSFTFTFAQTPACNVAVTYRLYGYAEATTGTGGPGDGIGDDIVVNGSVSLCPSVTTGAITGGPFTVGCLTDDAGVVAFTSSGTFDVENNYSVELSNSAGSFAAPTVIGTLVSNSNSGNINFTIPPGMSTSGSYKVRVTSSNPSLIGTESAAISITLSGGPCNTITTGALSAASYTVSCLSGTTGSIVFTSTGTFNAGNNYVAELSDASGNFGSPVTIGSLSSTSNTGTINFALSSGLSGASYKVRVVSTNPGYIGSESAAFTINLTGGPCGPLFYETFDEANNSTSGIDNVGGVAWSTTCPTCIDANDYFKVESGTLTNRDSNGPAVFSTGSINISSCSESFYIKMDIQALGDMEQCAASPANNAIDFVSLEYRINGGTWIGAPGHYNCGATDGFNSTTVIYDLSGSGSTTYNSGCIPKGNTLELRITTQAWASDEYWKIDNIEVGCMSCIILPISLTYFSGTCLENNEIDFVWETASESNNNYFTLEKTVDGINFEEIARIEGAGNSYSVKNYSYKLDNLRNFENYFRLKQTDYDGNSTYSNIISAICSEGNKLQIYPNPSNGTFIVSGYSRNAHLVVFNDLGQHILTKETTEYSSQLDLSNYSDGIYFLHILSVDESKTIKLILSK
jgi:hypothetical protein